MTDRELLELAAKAEGYRVDIALYDAKDGSFSGLVIFDEGERYDWNPLADNREALRLGVSHGLFTTDCEFRQFQAFHSDEIARDGKPTAATRRAIVTIVAMVEQAKQGASK